MQWLSDWWNDIELWMTQQSFWLQFALVIVVVGPLCVGVAWLIDRLVDKAAARFGPARRAGHKLQALPEPERRPEPGDQPAGTAS
ncbi:hypothetical protein [Labedaea rhizosphaerae]|uniref:Uncharacterized protein n=1 Tax=Labedaea rhizosphaerae TaxID=598644 RepID=A0A4R6S8X0_LABRH|nr:hypothetical protein EV186_104274 [Labedaea rhizosphaerae]